LAAAYAVNNRGSDVKMRSTRRLTRNM